MGGGGEREGEGYGTGSFLESPKKKMFLAAFVEWRWALVLVLSVSTSSSDQENPEFSALLAFVTVVWLASLSCLAWLVTCALSSHGGPLSPPAAAALSPAVAITDSVDASLELALGAYPLDPGCT